MQTSLDRGTQHETLNLVIVVHHATDTSPELNYVTPRRGVAWVSAGAAKEGLVRLCELGRAARFLYLEGLLPAFFRQTLTGIGLELVQDDPILDPEVGGEDSTPIGRLVVYGAPCGTARTNLHEWLEQPVSDKP
ncbi:MAG: hypothetical protein IT320_04215 [Anaerolineae bacterium]|nr:hypothetical protein [Anaerolineae bacterium]